MQCGYRRIGTLRLDVLEPYALARRPCYGVRPGGSGTGMAMDIKKLKAFAAAHPNVVVRLGHQH